MLLNDAISLIRISYTKYLRRHYAIDCETQSSPSSVNRRRSRLLPVDSDTRRLICLLAADEYLTADELDCIIEYLQLRRRSLVAGNNDNGDKSLQESSNNNGTNTLVLDENPGQEVISVDGSSKFNADKAVTQQISNASSSNYDCATDAPSNLCTNQHIENSLQQAADITGRSGDTNFCVKESTKISLMSKSSEIQETVADSAKADFKKVSSAVDRNSENTNVVSKNSEQICEASAADRSENKHSDDEVILVTSRVPSAELKKVNNQSQVITVLEDSDHSDNDCLIISVDKSACAVDKSLKQRAAEQAIAVSSQNEQATSSQNKTRVSSQLSQLNSNPSSKKPTNTGSSSVRQSGLVKHASDIAAGNLFSSDNDKKSANDNAKTIIQKRDLKVAETTEITRNSQTCNSAIFVMSKSTCSVSAAPSKSSVSTQPMSAKVSTAATSVSSKSSFRVTNVNKSSVSTTSVSVASISSDSCVLATAGKSNSPIASSHGPPKPSVSSSIASSTSPIPRVSASVTSSVPSSVVSSTRSISSTCVSSESLQTSFKSNVSLPSDPLKSSISSTSETPVSKTLVSATAVSTCFLSRSSVSSMSADLAPGSVQQNNIGPKSVMDSIRAFSEWRKGITAGEMRSASNPTRIRGPSTTACGAVVTEGAGTVKTVGGVVTSKAGLSLGRTDVTGDSTCVSGSIGKRETGFNSSTVNNVIATTSAACSVTSVTGIATANNAVLSESGISSEKSSSPTVCQSAVVSSGVTVNTVQGSSDYCVSTGNTVTTLATVSTSVCVTSSNILLPSSSVSG